MAMASSRPAEPYTCRMFQAGSDQRPSLLPRTLAVLRRGSADYRVPISATIMVAALASVYVLGSQSASSFATYILAFYILASARHWRGLFLDWGFLGVVALLVYLPLTSLWSDPWDSRGALGQAIRAVLVFAFVVSLAECLQVDWFRQRMTWVLCAFAAIAACAAMWVYFATPPADGRLNGLGQLDTHVAAGMVFAAAAVCGSAWLLDGAASRPKLGVACALAGVAALGIAVVLTGSRNAMACGVLGLAALFIAHRANGARRYVFALGALAVSLGAALIAAYLFVPGADSLVLPRGDSLRLGIWSYYLGRIADDGLAFGLGILTDDLTEVAGLTVLHPHNLFLAVAWQGGLVGLCLLLVVVGSTFATLLRRFSEPEAKLALALWALALPGYLVDGHELIDKIGWTWLLFWLPVAIGIGLRAGSALDDARRFGALARPVV